MRISVLILRALVQELNRREVSTEEFCASVGLSPALLDDVTFRMPLGEYNRLVGRALAVTDDPQLGLHVGAHTPPAALTVFGHLVSSCRTLREAAEILFRFCPLLIEGAEWNLREDGDRVSLTFALPDELGSYLPYGTEVCMALVAGVIRPFIPNVTPTEITFRHQPTGPLYNYERIFECPVHFGAKADTLTGASEILDRPQLHTDESLREMLRRRAEGLLADLHSVDRLPIRIRDFVIQHEQPTSVSAGMLADAFGMSERTLRRRLVDRGMSLRDLIDATLRQMACSALEEDASRPIKEIAARLGFSELSGFYRAFKRWTGLTPAEFRSGHRPQS
jgi:AraC-like DNA-binding protein